MQAPKKEMNQLTSCGEYCVMVSTTVQIQREETDCGQCCLTHQIHERRQTVVSVVSRIRYTKGDS